MSNLRSGLNTLLLTLIVCLAGVVAHIATIRHAGPVPLGVSLSAVLLTLAAVIPPLWFSRWISHGATQQLAVVVWRFGLLLPVVLILDGLEGAERNCFLNVVLVCYFVALPLESWLLIREVKKSASS